MEDFQQYALAMQQQAQIAGDLAAQERQLLGTRDDAVAKMRPHQDEIEAHRGQIKDLEDKIKAWKDIIGVHTDEVAKLVVQRDGADVRLVAVKSQQATLRAICGSIGASAAGTEAVSTTCISKKVMVRYSKLTKLSLLQSRAELTANVDHGATDRIVVDTQTAFTSHRASISQNTNIYPSASTSKQTTAQVHGNATASPPRATEASNSEALKPQEQPVHRALNAPIIHNDYPTVVKVSPPPSGTAFEPMFQAREPDIREIVRGTCANQILSSLTVNGLQFLAIYVAPMRRYRGLQ